MKVSAPSRNMLKVKRFIFWTIAGAVTGAVFFFMVVQPPHLGTISYEDTAHSQSVERDSPVAVIQRQEKFLAKGASGDQEIGNNDKELTSWLESTAKETDESPSGWLDMKKDGEGSAFFDHVPKPKPPADPKLNRLQKTKDNGMANNEAIKNSNESGQAKPGLQNGMNNNILQPDGARQLPQKDQSAQVVQKQLITNSSGTGPRVINSKNPAQPQVSRPFTFLATTNEGFIIFAKNWLESLKRSGVNENITLIAEDIASYEELRKRNETNLHVRLAPQAKAKESILKFGSTDYNKLVNKRPAYILDFLDHGIDVLFSDVDIVLLQNPMPYFRERFDLYLQVDRYAAEMVGRGRDMICAGFAYYSATDATRRLVRRWIKWIDKRPSIPDQQLLNMILKDRKTYRSLKISKLQRTLFVNGLDYFNATWRGSHITRMPVMVHNNWIKGYDIKMDRFRGVGMWYVGEDSPRNVSQEQDDSKH